MSVNWTNAVRALLLVFAHFRSECLFDLGTTTAENPDTKPFAESYAETFQTDPVESQFLQPEENEGSNEDDASSDDGRMRSRKGISVVKVRK